MAFYPTISLRFMSLQVIHNHMDFLLRVLRNDVIHKIKKLPTTTARIVARLHLSSSYIQSCRESGRPMPTILMICTGQRFAVGQLKPSLRPFECLNCWLLIHAYHHRILRGIQIKPYNISCLTRKFRIRRDAPTAPSLKADTMFSQYRPNLMAWDTKAFRHKTPIPLCISCRRRIIQFAQNQSLGLIRILTRLTTARLIHQPLQAFLSKAQAPLAHTGSTGSQPFGNLYIALTPRSPKNDLSPFSHTLRRGVSSNQSFELASLIRFQCNWFSFPAHNARKLQYYAYYVKYILVPIQKWTFFEPLRQNDHHHCAQDALLKRVFSVTASRIAMILT